MTMRNYGCYVYYDEQWNPYYVGKGSRRRARNKSLHSVPVPPTEFVQWFFFDEEYLAYECEMELISFWGRQSDGGCLMNLSLGGPGRRGCGPSQEARDRLSQERKGRTISVEQKAQISRTLKGRTISPEVRARMAEGQRKRRLKEKQNA